MQLGGGFGVCDDPASSPQTDPFRNPLSRVAIASATSISTTACISAANPAITTRERDLGRERVVPDVGGRRLLGAVAFQDPASQGDAEFAVAARIDPPNGTGVGAAVDLFDVSDDAARQQTRRPAHRGGRVHGAQQIEHAVRAGLG